MNDYKVSSQQGVGIPRQKTGTQRYTYTSILLSRPDSKSFRQPYLGQAVTEGEFNTLLVIHPLRAASSGT